MAMALPCAHRAPFSPRQEKMAHYYRASQASKSVVVPIYFLMACLGKLVFGFGTTLIVKGALQQPAAHAATAIGAVLCSLGLVCIIVVAFGFGAAARRCHNSMGIFLKACSILGALLIACGYASNQYFVSTGASLDSIRLTFLPLAVGASMLTGSLPNFVAYTELVRGRCAGLPVSKRPVISMWFLGLGIGIVFAGWVSGEKGQWQEAFNAVVLTVALALLYAGVAIFWSNHLHREAEVIGSYIIIDTVVPKDGYPDMGLKC